MFLKSLTLHNFRNIEHLTIDWHPEFNFIFGRNAQGKTNLLEAIALLAQLKSFRTSDRRELMRTGTELARIDGILEKDDLSWEMSVTLTASERHVTLNGKKPPTRKAYHGLLPLILFEPRHIYLFRDTPSERRRFLNQAVFLQDTGFLELHTDYEKVIQQKNRLLKDRRDSDMIDVWNDRLITLGANIIAKRLRWLSEISTILAAEYEALAHSGETLSLTYLSSASGNAPLAHATTSEDIMAALTERLNLRRQDEIDRGESLVGPHRDDFLAQLNDRALGRLGSQGENRSAIIALKLAQLKCYTQTHGKTPLFLLDDIASELDEERCHHLFTYLARESAQVFITTTEKRIEDADFAGHFRSFFVASGSVTVLT
jgi:DNA replication and repair protein RecF